MTAATANATPPLALADLAELVRGVAGHPEQWLDRIRLRSDQRWFECVDRGANYDVWVISWLPGQGTGFHDHGGSSGAFVVATGTLEEHRPGVAPLTIGAGEVRAFGSRYAHDVRNASSAPAISIHAYSPPLTSMNKYELTGEHLVPLGVEETRPSTPLTPNPTAVGTDGASPAQTSARRTIGEVLAAARARLKRLSPRQAQFAFDNGALLVDIRPAAQRAAEGQIPAALVVERNVLEWRFDPRSDARLPVATDHDLKVVIFCSEGYTSSLAAAALQDLGLLHATDMVGGFKAWRESGLPITQSS